MVTCLSPRTALLGVAVMLLAGSARAGEQYPADWRAALALLREVDLTVAQGDTPAAVERLRAANPSWVEPLPAVVARYREVLTRAGPDAVGVAFLADAIVDIEDAALREELQDRILALRPLPQAACAAILHSRGLDFAYRDQLAEALALFQKTLADCPDSGLRGALLFNTATVLRQLGRYGEAIAVFEDLLGEEADNRRLVGATIMDVGYTNYHHRAALGISLAYEEQGRFGEAFDWIRRAQIDFPHQAFCGHCADAHRAAVDCRGDHVALRAGGLLALQRVPHILADQWPAWLLLAIWPPFAWRQQRRRNRGRTSVAHWTLLVVTAAALFSLARAREGVWLSPPWLDREATTWLTLLKWLLLLVGVALLLLARQPARLRLAAAVLAVATVAHVAWAGLVAAQLWALAWTSLRDALWVVLSHLMVPAAAAVSATAAFRASATPD